MSAASEKIKEYLKQYQTSDKWVDPNTGNKLSTQLQGITQTNINGSGANGQSYKYTLVEDTRESGYSYLLILFKINKETDDLDANDPVVFKVHKPHTGPEPFVASKQGIDYANAKRKEAGKKIEEDSGDTSDSATGTIEGYDPDNTTDVPSDNPAEEGTKGKFMSGFYPPEGWTGFEDFYAQLREHGISLPKYGEDYKFGTEHLDAWNKLQQILNKPESRDHKWTDQQVLMSTLPELLYVANDYFKEDPKYYIRTTDADVSTSPIQKLTKINPEQLAMILEATNLDLASLVPKIQLWKIYYDDAGNTTDEVYIPFSYDSRNLIEDIYHNRESRGDDVGIQGVNLVFDNQNPATAEKLLGCTIRFMFQNADTLTKERGEKFKYVDLFAWEQTESSSNIDRDKYDIVMKVGYDVDSPITTISRELREALQTQEQMFKLGLTGYDLSFEPNGALTVNCEYSLANIGYFSDNRNEVLGVIPLLNKSGEANNRDSENPAAEDPDDTRKEIDKLSLYNRITTYMVQNDMIHTYVVADYAFDTSKANGSSNDYAEDADTEAVKEATTSSIPDTDKRTIQYFYYGDLIEAIMATNWDLFEQMEARKFAFVLDNAGYQFFKGRQVSIFNISKTPVAMESYNEWMQQSIIKKDIKIYSLMNFLKNAVQNFAGGILRTKCPGKVGSDYNSDLNRQVIQLPDGLNDTEGSSGTTALETEDGITFYTKTSESYHEYYVVYDEELYKERMSDLMGEFPEDERYSRNLEEGIPHFYVGADKGLMKSFSFQKADLGGQIAIIRNLETSNAFQQLWSIFNVSIDFVGNNLMSVGKMIYLDPTITGLGSPFKENSVSNLMGLGGYYLVQSVSHSYYPDWSTTVNATVVTPASQKQYKDDPPDYIYY